MNHFESILKEISAHLLLISSFIILFVSIILSFKTKFVQFRMLPRMFKSLFIAPFNKNKVHEGSQTILAHKALFTAMSTTIGISSIVSPAIAIRLGGPGALLGFLLTTIFGSAANFTEVTFALYYRKQLSNGTIMGGPMQYLKDELSAFWGKWYAFFCLILMIVWSAAQSNQLAAVLSSELLGKYAIAEPITGIFLALSICLILIGGIKRIGNFSEKLVPTMFFLYVSASLWIICANYTLLPSIFKLILDSALKPTAFAAGVVVGGFANAFRWGIFKGVQSNEAGIGTSTIPNSMAETSSPTNQGILSMAATYSAGFICILSGLVTLLCGTWNQTNVKLGINMIAYAFSNYFSYAGIIILTISAFLFAFGTILGNSYNGSQCFNFLSKNRYLNYYYSFSTVAIFLGAILDVTFVWTIIDFFLIPVAVPHIIGILIIAFKKSDLLKV